MSIVRCISRDGGVLIDGFRHQNSRVGRNTGLVIHGKRYTIFIFRNHVTSVFTPNSCGLGANGLPILSDLTTLPCGFGSPVGSSICFIGAARFVGGQ